MSELCLIGEIVGVHGVRGDVKIRSYAQNPEDLAQYKPLTDKTGKRTYSITSHRMHNTTFVATLHGVNDRNAAERLMGTKLYVARDLLPPVEAHEFYYDDLIGLQARRANGAVFGTIISVNNYGAGDVIEIMPESGKSSELFLFTHAVFPETHIAQGYVVIVPPDILRTDDESQDTPQ